jgi:hypothetical protein
MSRSSTTGQTCPHTSRLAQGCEGTLYQIAVLTSLHLSQHGLIGEEHLLQALFIGSQMQALSRLTTKPLLRFARFPSHRSMFTCHNWILKKQNKHVMHMNPVFPALPDSCTIFCKRSSRQFLGSWLKPCTPFH